MNPTTLNCPAEKDSGKGGYLRFEITGYSQSIENNTTTINWKITVQGTPWVTLTRSYLEIAGSKVHDLTQNLTNWSAGAQRASGSTTINHAADGSLSFNVFLKQMFYWSHSDARWASSTYTQSASANFTAASIPRQANMTGANNFNDIENPYFTYSNPAGNAVTDLQACLAWSGSEVVVPYRAISKTGSSYTFSLSEGERNAIRNGMATVNSKNIIYYLRTTIGGTNYYSTITRTVTIVNGNPTFSNFTYKDTNASTVAITGNDQVLIKGYSTLQVLISAANKMVANKGSTAKNYTAEIDSRSGSANYSTADLTINLGTILNDGTKRLNVRAYDSRNNSTLAYKDITVHNYDIPAINASVSRLNNFENQTTLKVAGSYSRLTISGSDKNTVNNIDYRYREAGGTWGGWIALTKTVGSGTFNCTDALFNLDNNKQFEFEVRVIDKLVTTVRTLIVDVGIPPFFISDNKKSIGVNCIPPSNAQPGDVYSNGAKMPSIDALYPIRSVYLSVETSNPGTRLGGTWVRMPYGFLLNWSSGNPLDTGGSFTTNDTAINTAQMPAHAHSGTTGNPTSLPDIQMRGYGATLGTGSTGWRFGSGGGSFATGIINLVNHTHSFSTGNNGSTQGHSHYHEPPWVKIYAWYRTA